MSIKHEFLGPDGLETRTLTKAKAIRMHCMSCCCWQQSEVAKCVSYDCVLYPFRFGNEKGLERKHIPNKEQEAEDDEWEELTDED